MNKQKQKGFPRKQAKAKKKGYNIFFNWVIKQSCKKLDLKPESIAANPVIDWIDKIQQPRELSEQDLRNRKVMRNTLNPILKEIETARNEYLKSEPEFSVNGEIYKLKLI